MPSGRLRTRISILRRSEGSQNSSGEPAITWSLLVTCFARRIDKGAREVYVASQTWAEATSFYEIHNPLSITFQRTDGIVEGDPPALNTTPPTIDILGISDPDEDRRRRLYLVCREYKT